MAEKIRFMILFLALAFSFGGFTFYSAVVIPTGTEVFSATEQGFVTRSVTLFINLAHAVTLVILIWDGIAIRSQRSRRGNGIFVSLLVVFAICLVVLVVLHPRLDGMLDREDMVVIRPRSFYLWHRAYLWTSTVQWLATLGMIGQLSFETRRS